MKARHALAAALVLLVPTVVLAVKPAPPIPNFRVVIMEEAATEDGIPLKVVVGNVDFPRVDFVGVAELRVDGVLLASERFDADDTVSITLIAPKESDKACVRIVGTLVARHPPRVNVDEEHCQELGGE